METKRKNNTDDAIDNWIYHLRQFIYLAIRNYSIQATYDTVKPGHEFSMCFEYYVVNGRMFFDQFKKELRNILSQSVNPGIILKDIKAEFEPEINQYKEWYEQNKKDTEIFKQYNPYEYMFELILWTEQEIKKYLPDYERSPQKALTFEDLFKDKDKAKRVKELFESRCYTNNGKWQGLTDEKSELAAAYYVLKPILKPIKLTPALKIFYKEFGLTVGKRQSDGCYVTERMLNNEPFNDSRIEFEKLFSDLLKQ